MAILTKFYKHAILFWNHPGGYEYEVLANDLSIQSGKRYIQTGEWWIINHTGFNLNHLMGSSGTFNRSQINRIDEII